MSTPELLAKREQRRRMEAQAAAMSRQGLSRRLLQPIQQPNSCAPRQTQDKQHSIVPGLASQPAARNMFSRVGLKRSAAAAAPPAPPAEDTGISAEDLAKVRRHAKAVCCCTTDCWLSTSTCWICASVNLSMLSSSSQAPLSHGTSFLDL
jgi:hypothetical protein